MVYSTDFVKYGRQIKDKDYWMETMDQRPSIQLILGKERKGWRDGLASKKSEGKGKWKKRLKNFIFQENKGEKKGKVEKELKGTYVSFGIKNMHLVIE